MVTKGLLVRLEALPGREGDVEQFLRGVMPVIEREPATTALFALRFGPSTFGIFNAFPDEAGRQAHIGGDAAIGLSRLAADALAAPPAIEAVDIVGRQVARTHSRPRLATFRVGSAASSGRGPRRPRRGRQWMPPSTDRLIGRPPDRPFRYGRPADVQAGGPLRVFDA